MKPTRLTIFDATFTRFTNVNSCISIQRASLAFPVAKNMIFEDACLDHYTYKPIINKLVEVSGANLDQYVT